MVVVCLAMAAALFSAAVAWYMRMKYLELKRESDRKNRLLEKFGIYTEILQGREDVIRKRIRGNADTIAKLMDIAYYSCDNFQKYQGAISEKFAKLYGSGALQELSSNIVYMANAAENGAFYALSTEYDLTELELRTCSFIYFGFKWQETCTADSLTENAYNVRCSRIRKKFGMAKEERIPVFLENWCRKYKSSSSVQ